MKKELISAYEFAKRKNVTNTAVYNRMKRDSNPTGEIIPEIVGKHQYIDWNKYSYISFDEKATNRNKRAN